MPASSAQIPARPRKNPTQSRSRATVEAVLSATAHILESRGVGALNTNAVAERAGVSIGSLYQYFPSKDAILVALIQRERELFFGEMAQVADAGRNPSLGDEIAGLLRFGLSRHLRRPDLARVLEVEAQRLQPFIDCDAPQVQHNAAVVRLLSRHRRAILIEDLELAARDMSLIAKSLMQDAAQRGDADWDAVIDRTARAILGYLGADAHKIEGAAA